MITCLLFSLTFRRPPGSARAPAAALVPSSAPNRKLLSQGFKAGLTPQAILDQIEQADTTTYRQFGIVSFDGPPVTLSGSGLAGASSQYVGGGAGQAACAGSLLAASFALAARSSCQHFVSVASVLFSSPVTSTCASGLQACESMGRRAG